VKRGGQLRGAPTPHSSQDSAHQSCTPMWKEPCACGVSIFGGPREPRELEGGSLYPEGITGWMRDHLPSVPASPASATVKEPGPWSPSAPPRQEAQKPREGQDQDDRLVA
jgi:hypothetical protein